MADPELREFVVAHLRSAESSWNIGAFGAIAEFHRDSSEPAEISELGVVTARGAIAVRLQQRCRAFAYELLSARRDLWLHGVALCLPEPEARMSGRTRITDLGPDREALRRDDRGAILFDLGLGLANCDFCVRTADPEVREALRAAGDAPLLANGPLLEILTRRSPHRVMLSRLGRIEVFQRIGAKGGPPPTGPHTHLLPRFVRQRRTHAANVPVPKGWLPCVSLYPPNPIQDEEGRRKPLDRAELEAFRALLERFGDADHLRTKREVTAAVRGGEDPDPLAYPTRSQRAACRIALRQLRKLDGASPPLERWLCEFDVAPEAESLGAH
jgi:hypothetical protein